MRHHQISTQTFKIITQYGDMLVVRQGVQAHQSQHHHHHHAQHSTGTSANQHQFQSASQQTSDQQQQQQQTSARPIIMTFHDLGLNSELQFATFCECDEVKLMLQTFTMIHVNFIGQEFELDGRPACSLPEDFKYPTVEQMAECVVDICAQLRVRSFIGLAVGAGAHIVSSLALLRPDLVHGLFLINPVLSSCSITEWLCFKMSAIASNHQIAHGGGGGGAGSHATSEHDLTSQTTAPNQNQENNHEKHHHHHHPSGLRKLWNAVHHHSSSSSSHHGQHQSPSRSGSSVSSKHSSLAANESGGGAGEGGEGGEGASGKGACNLTGESSPATTTTTTTTSTGRPPAGYRLRQLILSRNFKMGKHHQRHEQQPLEPAHEVVDDSAETPGGAGETSTGSERVTGGANSTASTASAASASAAPLRLKHQQHKRRQSVTNSIDTSLELAAASAVAVQKQRSGHFGGHPGGGRARRFSGGSTTALSQQLPAHYQAPRSPTGRSSKRPPIEYLMYHHFGSASFQRFRRPSAESSDHNSNKTTNTVTAAAAEEEAADQRQQQQQTRQQSADSLESGNQQRSSFSGSSGSNQSATAAAAAVAANLMIGTHRRASRDSTTTTTTTSAANVGTGANEGANAGAGESLPSTTTTTTTIARKSANQVHHRPASASTMATRSLRSNSISCLSAQHLASIPNERQRVAYMQMVYKQHFSQINSHNLWLFAHSFIKRRTLNLRKDCGAAAHAAAAAAALGTSICAAFVGIASPPSAAEQAATQHNPISTTTTATTPTTQADLKQKQNQKQKELENNQMEKSSSASSKRVNSANQKHHHHQIQNQQQQQQQQQGANKQQQQQQAQQALVAGTKVKRTFTCQTLIMCSSVQIHCERALKLMSLLNPLQATWIKTDQMLVLEEKPEKVCQALRLFLQGIGYSMSTYERRLRLNSAQNSFSSADSNGSVRSLSELTPAKVQQQQQQQHKQATSATVAEQSASGGGAANKMAA